MIERSAWPWGALLDWLTFCHLPIRGNRPLHAFSCWCIGACLAYGWGSTWPIAILGIYGAVRFLIALLNNLFLMAVFVALAAGSVAFPPLAIVAVGLMIYLLLKRLDYFYTHWRVICLGILLYSLFSFQAWGGPFFDGVGIPPSPGLLVAFFPVMLTVVWAVDKILCSFYLRGYTTNQIHEIATTVPFMFALLLLAIAGIAADFVPDASIDVVGDPPIDPPTEPSPAPEVMTVNSYARTNPDGILENNLSYRGDVPNGTPESPGVHVVRGHIRTAPDGILENNLSYEGPSSTEAQPDAQNATDLLGDTKSEGTGAIEHSPKNVRIVAAVTPKHVEKSQPDDSGNSRT